MAAVGNVELQVHPKLRLLRPPPLPRVLYTLLLNPGHKFGSIEEQIVTLAARFQTEDSLFLPLFISSAADANVEFYRQRGIEAECLDLTRVRPAMLRRLLGLLSTHRIDVVHWNFTSPLGNAYLWLLTLLRPGLRHFFTDHISRVLPLPAPPQGPKRWLKRLMLRRYAEVLCVSEFVRDCLHHQDVFVAERLSTCLHFVNTDRFRPDAGTRERLRRVLEASERFVVLAVGQLIEVKGIDVLIRAGRCAGRGGALGHWRRRRPGPSGSAGRGAWSRRPGTLSRPPVRRLSVHAGRRLFRLSVAVGGGRRPGEYRGRCLRCAGAR